MRCDSLLGGVIFALSSFLLSAEGLHAVPQSMPQSLDSMALHLDWMNLAIEPGDNFYEYANGRWKQENPIPKAYASWDNFRILQDNMEKKLNDMMCSLANNPQLKPGSIEQKIGDFYDSGMNQSSIDKEAYAPLNPLLQTIDGVSTQAGLQALIPELQLMGVNVLFNVGSQQDFKDSQLMIAGAMQGGLGLPDRDYYCLNDPK